MTAMEVDQSQEPSEQGLTKEYTFLKARIAQQLRAIYKEKAPTAVSNYDLEEDIEAVITILLSSDFKEKYLLGPDLARKLFKRPMAIEALIEISNEEQKENLIKLQQLVKYLLYYKQRGQDVVIAEKTLTSLGIYDPNDQKNIDCCTIDYKRTFSLGTVHDKNSIVIKYRYIRLVDFQRKTPVSDTQEISPLLKSALAQHAQNTTQPSSSNNS